MADPLLNTLCSICHTGAPKYTCPGCGAHTCSLACSRQHKSWANCDGRRDPTAYVPASRLKTPAGVDHDYNFLSAIERERGRNQREAVEERGLFSQKELGSGLDDPYSFRKQWFGENVHFHPVGGAGSGGPEPRLFGSDGEDSDGDGGGVDAEARNTRRNIPARASQLTQRVRQRLAAENVRVVQMPVGMTRQRENTTGWNRKARRINWCVEWILYDGGGDGDGEEEGGQGLKKQHTRIRHNALETTPLYKALGNSMAWYKKGHKADDDEAEDDEDIEPALAGGRRNKPLIHEVKEERGGGSNAAMQDSDTATWPPRTQYPTQSPFTTAWCADTGATATSWDADAEVDARRRHRFYLLRPLTPVGRPRELIPLAAADELGAALSGRTVLEYPTIYVLPPHPPPPTASSPTSTTQVLLPEGHVLGSTERRAKPPKRQQQPAAAAKRKTAPGSKDDAVARQQPAHKRQAVGGGGEGGGIAIRSSERGGGRGRGRDRGRGGGRGARVLQPGRQRNGGARGDMDAEEGEVNSDGDEVVATAARATGGQRRAAAAAATERADTSSSDPDSSSSDDEDDDDDDGQDRGFWGRRPRGGGMDVDVDEEDAAAATTAAPTAPAISSAPVQGNNNDTKRPGGIGLVDYGSDSSEDGSEDEGDDADLATLEPENPELVAGAIQEIVGLLS